MQLTTRKEMAIPSNRPMAASKIHAASTGNSRNLILCDVHRYRDPGTQNAATSAPHTPTKTVGAMAPNPIGTSQLRNAVADLVMCPNVRLHPRPTSEARREPSSASCWAVGRKPGLCVAAESRGSFSTASG